MSRFPLLVSGIDFNKDTVIYNYLDDQCVKGRNAMAILYFSDVLRKVGLDPAKVKLIRHALTDKGFKSCYDKNMVLEYTRQQKSGFSKNYDYWCVFISGKGTLAKLFACYRVGNSVPDTPDAMPKDFPHPEWFQGENAYFDLEHIDFLKDYEGRLTIDWGNSARMWHQKGTTGKPIVAIQADEKKVFSGFENLILTYDELKNILENQEAFDAWHTAMSAVNAVYLIADRKEGTQYVGSAYGKDGLWGRWAEYIATGGHGGNKKMHQAMTENPQRCHDLQFSVLQILSKSLSEDEIIKAETLWKNKLLTKEHGWNDN